MPLLRHNPAAALAAVAALLASATPLAAQEQPTTPPAPSTQAADPAPPVALGTRISASPEDIASIALEKPVTIAPDLRITHIGVGRFDRPENDGSPPTITFVPSTSIPLVPGEQFGWVIRFDTTRDSIELSEDFSLPEPIKVSGDTSQIVISDDGKTATSPQLFPNFWDWVMNSWGFEEGDPTGPHEFVVRLTDGTEIARLPFTVTPQAPR